MKEQTESKRRMNLPGEPVSLSGVYQVRHYRHRLPHEATLLEGEVFPQCRYCRAEVRFRLMRGAERVEEDYDFRHDPGPVLVR
jgi:hypothetical protein